MASLSLVSRSPQETQCLGRLLGQEVQQGDLFLLSGALGTGKTCLIQGIAWGLGVEEYARSPSFVLATRYQGRLPLYHIDLFRIDDPREALDIGLEEYLWGDGVCVIEWAEKAASVLPRECLWIELKYRPREEERSIGMKSRGRRYHALLEKLGEALKIGLWSR